MGCNDNVKMIPGQVLLHEGYHSHIDIINRGTDRQQKDRSFYAGIPEDRRRKLVRGWKRAVQCALYWADHDGDMGEE